MAINIGDSSINSIYIGDTKVKSVYLGDKLVYAVSKPEVDIDNSYNYFVFDTTLGIKTVTLQNYRGGDTTEWDGITDWGDGTLDTNLSHKYAKDGTYTVKTKYLINEHTGDESTKNMLIECININKNMTSYRNLFQFCRNLISVNTTNFNTSKVTNMASMFFYCESLTSLDLSNFDVSNVTNIDQMFFGCSSLTNINIYNWNTSKITSMYGAFYGCSKLISLDLSNWNTLSVIYMDEIFGFCDFLISLNISNWNMDNVTDYNFMFSYTKKLKLNKITMTNCNSSTKSKIQEALSHQNEG